MPHVDIVFLVLVLIFYINVSFSTDLISSQFSPFTAIDCGSCQGWVDQAILVRGVFRCTWLQKMFRPKSSRIIPFSHINWNLNFVLFFLQYVAVVRLTCCRNSMLFDMFLLSDVVRNSSKTFVIVIAKYDRELKYFQSNLNADNYQNHAKLKFCTKSWRIYIVFHPAKQLDPTKKWNSN